MRASTRLLRVSSTPARLAVLGSPIEHSKSPALHRAAYALLGLDWEYTAIEVDGGSLRRSSTRATRRGAGSRSRCRSSRSAAAARRGRRCSSCSPARRTPCSSTRPGAAASTPMSAASSARSAMPGSRRAERRADRRRGHRGIRAHRDGAARRAGVPVLVRRPRRRSALVELGAGSASRRRGAVGESRAPTRRLVVSTCPGGADSSGGIRCPRAATRAPRRRVRPVAVAPRRAAGRRGRHRRHGLEMLLHQALLQVRIFVNGDSLAPLERRSRRGRRHARIPLLSLWKDSGHAALVHCRRVARPRARRDPRRYARRYARLARRHPGRPRPPQARLRPIEEAVEAIRRDAILVQLPTVFVLLAPATRVGVEWRL